MRSKIFYLLALALVMCCFFTVACTTEELDHEHNYTERTFNATCVKDGRQEKICTECEDVILVAVIPAKGHNPSEWQVKTLPTCTVNKIEEKVCMDCGETVETKVHELVGHTPSDWQVLTDASCSENLIEGKICTVCAELVERRVGEKLLHDFVAMPITGTCAVGAHILHTCKLCGYSERTDFEKVTDSHTEGVWIVEIAPTCTSDGVKKQICTTCSTTLNREAITMDPNNHSFLVETLPPEADGVGYTKHICKECGYEITNAYETNLLPSQIYEMIASATVRIESCNKDGKLQSVGSGFFISENGEIVTSYHVIAGAYNLKVKLYGGTEYPVATVKGYDVASDLAILKVDLTGNSYLKISTSSVKTGDPVYALGSPLGIDDVFTDGVVSNPSKSFDGIKHIVFSAPVAPGNSGGPLVNSQGEVVGINNQIATDGQNLNFAIAIEVLNKLDTTNEKSVYDTYLECLSISGVNALKYYVMLNYDEHTIDGKYIINSEISKETSTAYGRAFQLIYDEDEGLLYISINWLSENKPLYSAEFILDGMNEEYSLRFYDHAWSQYTAKGKLSTVTRAISDNGALDASVYSKILSFDFINYANSGSNVFTKDKLKALYGMAYIHMLDSFNTVLSESGTELTLEHFNLQEYEVKEAEAPSEN